MNLVNKEAFGPYVPGDEVEVPDGALYDTTYWEEAAPDVAEMPVAEMPANDTKKGDK